MSYRVLIADDEIFVRNLLKKNLQASQLPIQVVAVAEDGQEALEMALEFLPDIVITDIEMPFMNGLELIRALQEREIRTKNIIISGYDEFDYARTAISLGVTDYLLKPFMPKDLMETFEKIIRELDSQNTLKQNLQMLRQQADKYKVVSRKAIIKSLLEGNAVSAEEMGKIGFTDLPSAWYLTCIIRMNGAVWNFEDQEQTEEFLKLIQDDYFSELLRFYGLGLNGDTVALCFQATGMQEAKLLDEVVRGLERLSHSMKQYYDMVLYCSVGRAYRKASMLKASYEDARSAWKEALDAQKRIWLYGAKQPNSYLTEQEISDKIRHLKSCIRGAVCAGNRAEAGAQLQQLMQMYALETSKGSEYVFISAGELVYGIADDMNKMGLEKADQSEILNLNQRANVVSLLEVKEIMERYLDACCGIVSENLSANRAESAVRLVQNYVENHLKDRDLSMEQVGEMVHFSVSYLRQIFKEVTGESFNEYLIRKRMERAGQLLRDTSMKIQDISESCGYENPRYFASSFKKFFGCTPTEYKTIVLREKNQEEK